jgi:outer membrane receptor for ferrienterochelin and colicin
MRFPLPRHAAAPKLALTLASPAMPAKRLGGYGLLKLYTTWRVAPDWSLLLRLDNALDKRYELARKTAQPDAAGSPCCATGSVNSFLIPA